MNGRTSYIAPNLTWRSKRSLSNWRNQVYEQTNYEASTKPAGDTAAHRGCGSDSGRGPKRRAGDEVPDAREARLSCERAISSVRCKTSIDRGTLLCRSADQS